MCNFHWFTCPYDTNTPTWHLNYMFLHLTSRLTPRHHHKITEHCSRTKCVKPKNKQNYIMHWFTLLSTTTTSEVKKYCFLKRRPIYSIFLVVPGLTQQYFFGGHFRDKVFFSFHVVPGFRDVCISWLWSKCVSCVFIVD